MNDPQLNRFSGEPHQPENTNKGQTGAPGGSTPAHDAGNNAYSAPSNYQNSAVNDSASGGATFEIDRSLQFVYSVITSEGGTNDYYWNNLELRVGDKCVVDGGGGYSFGTVAISRRPASLGCGCEKKERKKIKRRATTGDLERAESIEKKEKQALAFCRERVLERDLKMNLTRVMYTFDGNKAIFFFTADGRVDFRELLKDLVNHTRAKVEMRQIGVRDEAKMLGGCGPCGEELCCSRFLSDFAPVSIRMAKNQNLSLNPAKISGVCGRLMCCLAYEEPHYKKLQERAPKLGKYVVTPEGREAKVIQVNLLQERAMVIFEDESKEEFNTYDLTPLHLAQQRLAEERKRGEKNPVPNAKDRTDKQVADAGTVTDERTDKKRRPPNKRNKKRQDGPNSAGNRQDRSQGRPKQKEQDNSQTTKTSPPTPEGGEAQSRSARRRRRSTRSGVRRKPSTESE